MSESQRSGAEAAELEQLRREAAILRDQLQAAGGGARSPREVQQLEARIDSLAARNAKLMDTLKEARQLLLALREEGDRLGADASDRARVGGVITRRSLLLARCGKGFARPKHRWRGNPAAIPYIRRGRPDPSPERFAQGLTA